VSNAALVGFAVAIGLLELWRSAIAATSPRWVRPVAWTLYAVIVASGITSRWLMGRAFELDDAPGGEKARQLADHISGALSVVAIGGLAVVIAIVVLTIATVRSRRDAAG
jgi:formate hydrogenlyase subunit 3/multisubunit Na+/H+ antiporter MnhD subunit